MAMNFPDSPITGDIYGPYQWDGEKWVTTGSGDSGGGGGEVTGDYLPLAGGTMTGGVVYPRATVDLSFTEVSFGPDPSTGIKGSELALYFVFGGVEKYSFDQTGMDVRATGGITLYADPTSDLMAANKKYVDAQIAAIAGGGGGEGGAYLPLTGGTMTGDIIMTNWDSQIVLMPGGNQTNTSMHFGNKATGFYGTDTRLSFANNSLELLRIDAELLTAFRPILLGFAQTERDHAISKGYVDDAIAAVGGGGGEGGAYLPLAGGTLTGNLSINKSQPTIYLHSSDPATGVRLIGMAGGMAAWTIKLRQENTSNFTIHHHSDTGADLGPVLTFNRATGLGTLKADPVDLLGIATKQYVDAVAAGGGGGAYLPLTGGMVTGDLAVTGQLSSPTVYGKTVTVDGPDDYSTGGWIAVDRWQDGLTAQIIGKKEGVLRWDITLGNADPDGFPNENWAGSNFEIASYDNFGRNRDVNFRIDRHSGKATVHSNPVEPMGIATKDYVDIRKGTIFVDEVPPTQHAENALWWDNVEGQLYIKVYDIDYTYNWVQAVPDPYYMLKTTGGSMTGALLLAADPTQPLEAATKAYVDASAGGGGGDFLPLTGGTLTGKLTIESPVDGALNLNGDVYLQGVHEVLGQIRAQTSGGGTYLAKSTNAGEQSGYGLCDAHTMKWSLLKNETNGIVLLDYANNIEVFKVTQPAAYGTGLGIVEFKYTTPSTVPTDGAVVIAGGLGVAGNVNVAGQVISAGVDLLQEMETLRSRLAALEARL